MKILTLFGTRPEAIKLIPLIKELEKEPEIFSSIVCSTGQHGEALDQLIQWFDQKVDTKFDLLNRSEETTQDQIAHLLPKVTQLIEKEKPQVIFVQGDTLSAFVGALAGFYQKVKVFHIEAGLRTYKRYSPFPEEMHRRLITDLSSFHFSPTQQNRSNLLKEGISKDKIAVVGNTIYDALNIIEEQPSLVQESDFVDLLVTVHRRENWGEPIENICFALKELIQSYPFLRVLWPLHPNPQIQMKVRQLLGSEKQVQLTEPLLYPEFMTYLKNARLIWTDSGGVQEEVTYFGKPTLILREDTERPEGIEIGPLIQVGCDPERMIQKTRKLLEDSMYYRNYAQKSTVFGDGEASQKIIQKLKEMQHVSAAR